MKCAGILQGEVSAIGARTEAIGARTDAGDVDLAAGPELVSGSRQHGRGRPGAPRCAGGPASVRLWARTDLAADRAEVEPLKEGGLVRLEDVGFGVTRVATLRA
jgi:hypothetical protein